MEEEAEEDLAIATHVHERVQRRQRERPTQKHQETEEQPHAH
jgi:hypothetical protein